MCLKCMSKAIAKFFLKIFLKFLPSGSIKLFISIEATSPHESNLRAERNRNLFHNFFVYILEYFRCYACSTKKRAPRYTFFKNHELNCVPYMSISYLENMPIYCPLRKYKLSVRSFLDYCYSIVFVHDIVPLKRMFGA